MVEPCAGSDRSETRWRDEAGDGSYRDEDKSLLWCCGRCLWQLSRSFGSYRASGRTSAKHIDSNACRNGPISTSS